MGKINRAHKILCAPVKIGFIVLILIALFGLVVTGIVMAKNGSEKDEVEEEVEEYVSDEIIVKFKGDEEPFRVLKVPAGKVREKVKEYHVKREVEYAEPNYIAYAQWVPNDPYYGYQWHLDNPVYGGIEMEEAWNVSQGTASVVVAVVDTGIAYETYGKFCQAPDLAQTVFVPGYDFVNNNSHPNDDNRHGTHVAGTVAQSTNNYLGVAGVAFKTSLMPVKVLDSRGSGTYANVAKGIKFAADNGAKVINLSLGGSSDSSTLKDAVAYAFSKGVAIVAACGNDNKASCLYPAAYNDYVIAVGATQYDETKAPYSNYGSSLDLVAPGGNNNLDQNKDGYADGVLQQTFKSSYYVCSFAYYFFQGTSMATPHVSGVAALLLAKGNATTPSDIRTALQSTAENKGATGWDSTFGWGLVNAFAALNWTSVPQVPNNPPIAYDQSVITNEDTSVAITLTATDPDGDPLTYSIVASPLNGSLSGIAPNVTYTPNPNYNGLDSFTFKANDGKVDSNIATVSLTVNSINDPPVANAGPDQNVIDANGDGVEPVTLNGSASYDPDGTVTSYEWKEGTTVLGAAAIITVNFAVGTHTVNLTVTDNLGASASDTALITVQPKPAVNVTITRFDARDINLGDPYNIQARIANLNPTAVTITLGLKVYDSSGTSLIDTLPDKIVKINPNAVAEVRWNNPNTLASATYLAKIAVLENLAIQASDPFTVFGSESGD